MAPQPVAVIGMACRFPGSAINIEEFWRMLVDGRDAWSEIPRDRFNVSGWHHPDANRSGSFNMRGGHFLKQNLAVFDAAFFNISAAEATAMDPQQRMLLEVTYEALEAAGIPVEALEGSQTGVFVGSFTHDYDHISLRDPDNTPRYAATGTGASILANRISHAFNLAGTSVTVDTGCSASLVALDQACKALQLGDISLAIVAGVGLIFSPNTLVPMAGLNIMSPEGRCFTFDERANGYGRGEGVGVVILKKADDAQNDGDVIRAVILGTGTNQDGRTQGIVQPSKARQADNIRRLYNKADLDPRYTGYVECHGTGTQAGDLAELAAVSEALCLGRRTDAPLLVGSVKTNIGHLEGAAGVAGMIKAILVVEKGFIPKHLNYATPNPHIDFAELNLQVPLDLVRWPAGPRRASINSFGFGGTNAHAIVEDAAHFFKEGPGSRVHVTALWPNDSLPARAPAPAGVIDRSTHLFLFSARSEASLTRIIEDQAKYVSIHGGSSEDFLSNLAYTLSMRRSHFPTRTFVVAKTVEELRTKLEAGRATAPKPPSARVVLLFSGQGAQWFGMGQELMVFAPFAKSVVASTGYLRQHHAFELYGEDIDAAEQAQVGTVTIQLALVDLLRAVGVEIAGTLGHSSGEIAAAYAAGALDWRTCLDLAYLRGRHAGRLSGKGAMLAVHLAEEDAEKQVPVSASNLEDVDIACINGPNSVILSGSPHAIDGVAQLLDSAHISNRRLRVDVAYHSRYTREVAGDYRNSIRNMRWAPEGAAEARPKIFSSLRGRLIDSAELTPQYWADNFSEPVQFYKAVSAMLSELSPDVLLDVSPHSVLAHPIQTIFAARYDEPRNAPDYFPLMLRGKDDAETFLEAMGKVWMRGGKIDMSVFIPRNESPEPRLLLNLPSYPWNHSRQYWQESEASKANRFRAHGRKDLIGAPLENQIPGELGWRGYFRLAENPWMGDHEVEKAILYPAAGMVVMAIEAASQAADPNRKVAVYRVEDFAILTPIMIPRSPGGVEHMLKARQETDTEYKFSIWSRTEGGTWIQHATGWFCITYSESRCDNEVETDDDDNRGFEAPVWLNLAPRQLYDRMNVVGLSYGKTFRNIVDISHDGGRCCHSVIKIPDTRSTMPCAFEYDHVIHPATLDALIQTIFTLSEDPIPMLPYFIQSVSVVADLPKGAGRKFHGRSLLTKSSSREATAKFLMWDETMVRRVVRVSGLKLKSIDQTAPASSTSFLPSNRRLCSEVVWKRDVDSVLLWEAISVLDFIDLVGHKNPAARILQIGDHGWLATQVITKYGTPNFSEYTIACASASDAVEQRRSMGEEIKHDHPEAWHRVHFTAGVPTEEGRWDLVVICRSKEIEGWHGYKKLVKPKGWIVSWVGAEPLVDMLYHAPLRRFEIPFDKVIILLPDNVGEDLDYFARRIATHYDGRFARPYVSTCKTLDELDQMAVQDIARHGCISLLECEKDYLFTMSKEMFTSLHRLLSSTKNLVWLTRGGETGQINPMNAVFTGLARTLRSEDPQKKIISINIPHTRDPHLPGTVMLMWFACLAPDNNEAEFTINQEGKILVPRLMPLIELNGKMENEWRASAAISQAKVDANGTYLLVGGFGGLGRCVAQLLAEAGARTLAFITRRPLSRDADEFAESLRKLGVRVCSYCVDILDKQALKITLSYIQSRLPPLKGVVYCAGVVKDRVFPDMDYDTWKEVFAPKATGSWNLHCHLPRSLDFLIFLSSSSGIIGNRGQAAYAAGNCFQDALAWRRRQEGLYTVSLDLGLVLEAGMVAQNERLLDAMLDIGFIGIRLRDFRALILGAIKAKDLFPAQVVTAVGTGGLTLQNRPRDPFWTRSALFAYLNQVDAPPGGIASGGEHPSSAAPSRGNGALRAIVVAAKTDEFAAHLVAVAFAAALAGRKGMSPDEIAADVPLERYGLDSLDSMQLLGWVARETGVAVQTLEGVCITELATDVARRAREDAARADEEKN